MKKFIKETLTNFWRLHKGRVLKNEKLKNTHAGETCFIFANGASLKYYDISKLPNFPSIVCTYSLIDKRLNNLNVKYCTLGESYSLYPILYNTYSHIRRFQRNKIRPIFENIIARNQHVTFFVNLTNCYSYSCRHENVHHFYHFGDKTSLSYNLAGNFATCYGALDYMLGMAKYLGFSKAILLGCDYLGSPTTIGHFYSDTKPCTGPYFPEYCSRIKAAAEGIEVLVILPEGVSSPDFKYDSYERYFGLVKNYTENVEFIDSQYLQLMRKAAVPTQIIM